MLWLKSHISLNTGVGALEMINFLGAIELCPRQQIRELRVGFSGAFTVLVCENTELLFDLLH